MFGDRFETLGVIGPLGSRRSVKMWLRSRSLTVSVSDLCFEKEVRLTDSNLTKLGH